MAEPITVGAALLNAAISTGGKALSGPLQDLYQSAKSGVKSKMAEWSAINEIDSLLAKLEQIEFVRTVVSSQPRRLSSFYYPSRVVEKGKGKEGRGIACVDDIDKNRNILISGTVGQGKSMFMRYLCMREVAIGKKVPIFVELRDIDPKVKLQDLLVGQFSALGIPKFDEEILLFFLEKGTFTFFLDGFDEIKREYVLQVQKDLTAFANRFPATRWILSARPGTLNRLASSIPNLHFVDIAPLQNSDYNPFLKLLGVEDEHRAKLLTAIEGSSTEIKGILSTPLMLTLLNLTFGTSTNIPASLHEFYESLFNFLVVRHDETKVGYVREKATQLSNSDLQDAFEHFCFLSKEVGVSLSDDEFARCARDASKICGRPFTVDGFRADVTENVCLMMRDGLKTAFIHRSIQEFFAAFFIKHLGNEETVKRIYDSLRGAKHTSWSQELKFLEQIDRYRFLEHFWILNADELLRASRFAQKSKVKVSKVNFEKYLVDHDIQMVEVTMGKEKTRSIPLVSTSHAKYSASMMETVRALCPGGSVFFPDRTIAVLRENSKMKIEPIVRYLREHLDEFDVYLGRFRDHVIRVDKDLQKQKKVVAERHDSLSRILLK